MDLNHHISALQRQPCLLKTNSPQKLFGVVVDYVTVDHLSLMDKSRPVQFDGYGNVCPQIISPQWSNARPNFPTKKCVGGAKFGLGSRLGKVNTYMETV